MKTIETSLVNYLTFCSYRANRGNGMTPEQLADIFGPEKGAQMEAAYQRELPDHIVTFHYDPGTPTKYLVHGAPDQREAQRAALLDNGYHPGVLITVRECRPEDKKMVIYFGYEVTWVPLTEAQIEQIRFND